MGITETWMVTTAGQRNWTDACEREILARFNWNGKWGWMPPVIGQPVEKLKELKNQQVTRILEKGTSSKKELIKDPRPLPNTVNHEYGWLATKPDYKLERFGPFPLTMKVKVEPNSAEIEDEIARSDLERVKKARERKKQAKLERLMSEKNSTKPDDDTLSDGKMSAGPNDDADTTGSPEQAKVEAKIECDLVTKTLDGEGKPKDPMHVKNGKVDKVCCCTAGCACKMKTMQPNKTDK